MFTIAKPQFVTPSALSRQVVQVASSGKQAALPRAVLDELITAQLPPDGQGSGKTIGFFDQGLITGATLLFTPLISGVLVAGYYSVRFGLRKMKS